MTRLRRRFRLWWHREVLHHQQKQWGIPIPRGVPPMRNERILCECGLNP
jgi:hypothetical protein